MKTVKEVVSKFQSDYRKLELVKFTTVSNGVSCSWLVCNEYYKSVVECPKTSTLKLAFKLTTTTKFCGAFTKAGSIQFLQAQLRGIEHFNQCMQVVLDVDALVARNNLARERNKQEAAEALAV